MKNSLLIIAFVLFALVGALAQGFRNVDKSPMDATYFPDNFAHDRKGDEKALVRVLYSRPAKNGREVFGKLIPYGKVWRTGANENTEITFYQDATLQGKKIKAGTYSLFTIPNENEWVVILNKDLNYWGAYQYKEANDVARFTVTPKKSETVIENFSIQFPKGTDALLRMGWDTTVVELPIQF